MDQTNRRLLKKAVIKTEHRSNEVKNPYISKIIKRISSFIKKFRFLKWLLTFERLGQAPQGKLKKAQP